MNFLWSNGKKLDSSLRKLCTMYCSSPVELPQKLAHAFGYISHYPIQAMTQTGIVVTEQALS